MEGLSEKCNKLRKELTNYYKNIVVPLKEENAQLKERIKSLEAESARYRNMAQKLRLENKRLHDICEFKPEEDKFKIWKKGESK